MPQNRRNKKSRSGSTRASLRRGGDAASTKMGQRWSPTKMRVVSGELRGSKVQYNGDPATRPMKEKTREAVFSLLGGKFDGGWCLDLFGGTGILTFEAISRGMSRGLILELSRTTVRNIIANLEHLGIQDRVRVANVDSLRWLQAFAEKVPSDIDQQAGPWLVFACPPYRLWSQRSEACIDAIRALYAACPIGSWIVCETDASFQISEEIPEIPWKQRDYPPAQISIVQKPE